MKDFDDNAQDSVIEDVPSAEEPSRINHAEILGDTTLKLGDFLDQPMVFMTGDLYPADNRRSTRDGDWKRTELSLIQWINGDGKSWGLSVHPEGKTKDGKSIVPSENIDGARKDSAVKTMYAIGIDIDSGTSLQHVLDKLAKESIFAIVYTTFSHRKTEFELKHDDVMRKMKLEETPTRPQIQEYLRLHHATRFDHDFISKVEVTDRNFILLVACRQGSVAVFSGFAPAPRHSHFNRIAFAVSP